MNNSSKWIKDDLKLYVANLKDNLEIPKRISLILPKMLVSFTPNYGKDAQSQVDKCRPDLKFRVTGRQKEKKI